MTYFVYILASRRNGTLYIGVTNNLERRTVEHVTSFNAGSFTKKYGVRKLVYYEHSDNIESAIRREKQLKSWNRKWKLDLIENVNPTWMDLASESVCALILDPRVKPEDDTTMKFKKDTAR